MMEVGSNFECLSWKYQKMTKIWAIKLLTKWVKLKYMYGCIFFNIWIILDWLDFFSQANDQTIFFYLLTLDNFYYEHDMHAYEIQRIDHIF